MRLYVRRSSPILKGLIVDQSYNDERGTVTGSHLGASRAIHVQHPSDLHFRTLICSDRLGEPVVVASAPVQICSGASGGMNSAVRVASAP